MLLKWFLAGWYNHGRKGDFTARKVIKIVGKTAYYWEGQQLKQGMY